MRTSRVLLAFGLLVATASIVGATHDVAGTAHTYAVADLAGAFAGHAILSFLVTPNSRRIDPGDPRAVATSTRATGRVHSLLSRDPLGGGFCDGSSFCRGARTGDAFPRGRAPVFSRCPNGKNAAV